LSHIVRSYLLSIYLKMVVLLHKYIRCLERLVKDMFLTMSQYLELLHVSKDVNYLLPLKDTEEECFIKY
jgi:hypothetical protein